MPFCLRFFHMSVTHAQTCMARLQRHEDNRTNQSAQLKVHANVFKLCKFSEYINKGKNIQQKVDQESITKVILKDDKFASYHSFGTC